MRGNDDDDDDDDDDEYNDSEFDYSGLCPSRTLRS